MTTKSGLFMLAQNVQLLDRRRGSRRHECRQPLLDMAQGVGPFGIGVAGSRVNIGLDGVVLCCERDDFAIGFRPTLRPVALPVLAPVAPRLTFP